jgi:hypothetical protein
MRATPARLDLAASLPPGDATLRFAAEAAPA